MSQDNVGRALRGSVRALTGVLVIGVAATAAVILGAAPLPVIEHPPVSIAVDTLRGAERQYVCPGSFAVLGADPARPTVAVPVGVASITLAGQASGQTELQREEPGGSSPAVLSVPADRVFAAAQVQTVENETLSGLTAASCAEPANEQWLVGGTTALGASTTLALGNPAGVPATVRLTLFDENGQVGSEQTSSVLVPAGSERIVSINGYAPDRERLAVRVDSTGAAVTAALEISHVSGLQPFAVDTATRQLAAEHRLVFPGVANTRTEVHGPGDAGEADEYPVLVRLLSATGEQGTARVSALLADGGAQDLGTVDLVASAVGELSVKAWPEGATAVVVEADVPIVGGVLGSVDSDEGHDYAWFAPAPELAAGDEVAAAVVPGGELVLANPGSSPAEVRIADIGSAAAPEGGSEEGDRAPSGAGDEGGARTISVPAGGTATVQAATAIRLSSSAPIHAGVRLVTESSIAAYPVIGEAERSRSLTVYPR